MNRSAEESPHEVTNDNQGFADLISKASSGDTQALSDLLNHPDVEKEVSRIAAIVLARYGSRGVYENEDDLKHEVYANLLSNIGDLRSETQFVVWIHRVVRNTYLDRLRKSVLEERSFGDDKLSQTESTLGETQYFETGLREVLDKLDPEQRKILEMVTEGYTPRQIADKTGISISRAYRLVSEVLKAIVGEVDDVTTRMKKSHIEIEQEQALTRHLINELRA